MYILLFLKITQNVFFLFFASIVFIFSSLSFGVLQFPNLLSLGESVIQVLVIVLVLKVLLSFKVAFCILLSRVLDRCGFNTDVDVDWSAVNWYFSVDNNKHQTLSFWLKFIFITCFNNTRDFFLWGIQMGRLDVKHDKEITDDVINNV